MTIDDLPAGRCVGVVFHWCVAPETLILGADLRWIRADDVREGYALVGVTEAEGKGVTRKLVVGTVHRVARFPDTKRLRVMTDKASVVVSLNHPFLVRYANGTNSRWHEAGGLRLGDRIRFFIPPTGQGTSWEDGWLGGIFDGEGSLYSQRGGIRLSFAQSEGPTFRRGLEILRRHGYRVAERQHVSANRFSKKPVMRADITNQFDALRLLAQIRPERLIARLPIHVWGKVGLHTPDATVVGLELLDNGDVIGIETSSATLITNGFVSHNSAGRYTTWFSNYHCCILGPPQDGKILITHPFANNLRQIQPGDTYAAHVKGRNSFRLAVSAMAMYGATMNDAGQFPVTPRQIEAMCAVGGLIVVKYGLDVATEVRTHYEWAMQDGYYPARWDFMRASETLRGKTKWYADQARLNWPEEEV